MENCFAEFLQGFEKLFGDMAWTDWEDPKGIMFEVPEALVHILSTPKTAGALPPTSVYWPRDKSTKRGYIDTIHVAPDGLQAISGRPRKLARVADKWADAQKVIHHGRPVVDFYFMALSDMKGYKWNLQARLDFQQHSMVELRIDKKRDIKGDQQWT
ncbi:hypothetical protein E8E14_014593 [Neopestalotiopsis sp. 37M]|nr:hypothetical protein E8E14_014593 [Neopestalotiopsis sp. 37M]